MISFVFNDTGQLCFILFLLFIAATAYIFPLCIVSSVLSDHTNPSNSVCQKLVMIKHNNLCHNPL